MFGIIFFRIDENFQYNCQCMLLVSSKWLTSYASKRGGGSKAVLVSSGRAQNCASKLRVTTLLRDPFTIPVHIRVLT